MIPQDGKMVWKTSSFLISGAKGKITGELAYSRLSSETAAHIAILPFFHSSILPTFHSSNFPFFQPHDMKTGLTATPFVGITRGLQR